MCYCIGYDGAVKYSVNAEEEVRVVSREPTGNVVQRLSRTNNISCICATQKKKITHL